MTEQAAIPCTVMRGGTSKGLYFLSRDLPADTATRDAVLLAAMGSPDARQIDGTGGAHPLTSKVAVVSPASRPDADVDYLFLQVAVDKPEVSEQTIELELIDTVRNDPGGSWTTIRQHVRGNATLAAKVRDRLISAGVICNKATREGQFKLHLAGSRSEAGTALERLPFPDPDWGAVPSTVPVPPIGNGERERNGEPGALGLEQRQTGDA